MEIIETPLEGCVIIKGKLFGDERGFFLESYNKTKLADLGVEFEVKQVNFARSAKNVLRGLHYQVAPVEQGKLVGVVSGAVTDLAVDLRKDSPTYKQYFKLDITSPDTFFLVPRGFAHAYYALEDDTIFYYAVDNYYSPENERGIRFDDPSLNIDWGFKSEPIISDKDKNWSDFAETEFNHL